METSREPIAVRANRLNKQIFTKPTKTTATHGAICKEGLLDAFQALYYGCNSVYLKKQNKNIQIFVDKYKESVNELGRLRVNVTDFEIKNVIGRGHFGEVHLVREKQTGDFYAMKTIKKIDSALQNNVAFEEERDIMAETRSPWLTALKYAFQDESSLFLVMEYHPGGDLYGLLQRQGGTIPESAAVFYLGELLMALHDLHEMGFVHRDLKPDNVLLDRCGHVKLADFGSAARYNEKRLVSAGFPVGTPNYVAPEVLNALDKQKNNCSDYGISCDYWSLGVLAYELIVGTAPFTAQSTAALYSKITNHEKHLTFPSDLVVSQAFISLIKNLIVDSKRRYNYEQITQHILFNNLDLNTLRNQIPPYIPKITSDEDISNFSEIRPRKTEPNMENFKRKTHFSGRNLPFIGFTYIRDNSDDYTSSYSRNVKVKDETLQDLKGEVQSLRRKLLKQDGIVAEKCDLEKKFEEKCLKLEGVEHLRDKLERELARTMSECLALKRTLELERNDRVEIENKALDLIKSAKQKWEIGEKTRIESLLNELQEQKDKIAQLTNVNEQLKSALHLESKHKITAENIEKLNRKSVIGLESRLEKVTSETQNQLFELQASLSRERKEKQTIVEKCDVYSQKLAQTECEYKKLEILHKNTQNELNQLKTAQQENCVTIANYKQEIDELKCKLNVIGENKETQQELEKLLQIKKREFATLNYDKQKLQQEIERQQTRINDLTSERDLFEKKLVESRLNEENTKIKVKGLEEVLTHLQNGIAKLENSGSGESVLKEHVERLEQQLIESHENLALVKQELTQLKTKHWRMEKELENAEIDKRILQRESREYEKQIKLLNEEMENLRKQYENKETEIATMLQEIDSLKERVKRLEEECGVMNCLRNELNEKQTKIEQLLYDLAKISNEREHLEHKYNSLQNENCNLQKLLSDLKREKTDQTNLLETKEKQLQNTNLNLNALRDACVVLENQLVEYERLHDAIRQKQIAVNEERGKWLETMTRTQEEVREARKSANEEKSLRLLAETKCKRFVEDLNAMQKEQEETRLRYEELKRHTKDLTEQLNDLQEKFGDLEVTVNVKERALEELMGEVKYLKEANSDKLTLLANFREENYELKRKLEECERINRQLQEQTMELEQVLDEKLNYYNERELKSDATIQQQIKLINYLQTKIEEQGNKKKSFAEKLFHHSKKENVPSQFLQNALEMQLSKERQKNKVLRDEIENLKRYSEPIKEDVQLEGWIKVVGKTVQKRYAKITENTLYYYNEASDKIRIGSFTFKRADYHCKFIMEPLSSEINIPLSVNDLALAIKFETTPISQCWPPETFIFLVSDRKEKERWGAVFNTLFRDSIWMQMQGDFVFKSPDNWNGINCLIDLNENTHLIGTETGLYTSKFVHIEGPQQIHQIALMKSINTIVMIADEKRFLLRCDLHHVENVVEYASCPKPTLTFHRINLKNLIGFQELQVAKRDGKICVATKKQLIIADYELETKEFVTLRVLDTAEPMRCALFTRNETLIVGADKFFEIDLRTFEAMEFLDSRDLYRMKSCPIAVVMVKKQPIQYLCCFNEFGVFVDEQGRCIKERKEIRWNCVPILVRYVSPYLYVVQYQGLEMLKLVNDDDSSTMKINLPQPRFVGGNDKGIYLLTMGEVRFFNGKKLDTTDLSSSTNDDDDSTMDGGSSSDRFSFTSSVVQCLENGSETGSETNYQTRKVTFTDL